MLRGIITGIAGLGTLAMTTTGVHGQAFDGTKELAVVVEGLDVAAEQCGLNRESLVARTEKRIRDLQFTVNPDSKVNLNLKVETNYFEDAKLCVSAVLATINYLTPWTDSANQRVVSEITILGSGGLSSSPALDGSSSLLAFVDESIGNLVDEWTAFKPAQSSQ